MRLRHVCVLLLFVLVVPDHALRASSDELNRVVEEFYEEWLVLNPFMATFNGDDRYNDVFRVGISPQERAEDLALERKYLEKIDSIDPEGLSELDRTTWEIFRRNRLEAIEDARFPGHLLPVDQFFSVPNIFAMVGSGQSIQPFATLQDHDNWLKRAAGFSGWVDQAILNMREGMQQGIVHSRVVMEKVLPQLAAQVVDDPRQSTFYMPVRSLPDDVAAADRTRLEKEYVQLIDGSILPAYERLHEFIEKEYLPHTRETFGYGDLPGGAEWYAHQVRTNTTTDMSPEEIHSIGLQEVARLEAEIARVRKQIDADPELAGDFVFTGEEDMLQTYESLRRRVAQAAQDFFVRFPKADFEIRPVEAFRQASAAGASYQAASPDGSRPGIFYVNTRNADGKPKHGAEALYLHEAVPGHHFQISFARELDNLPRFRRFGNFTAYAEGWGLYAETIGKEMGLYDDPRMYVGSLQSELFRAKRLVVDTGLHAKGWSRDQAIGYMNGNVAEVERYMVIPGQALAYKVGQLRISQIRRQAEEQLGERFDVATFHDEVLKDGPLPLDVLEAKIDRWVQSQLPASAKR